MTLRPPRGRIPRLERYPDFPELHARGIPTEGMGPGMAWFTDPAGDVLSALADPA